MKPVLIIDDEEEICLNLQSMFSHEGCEADYAVTAKEGIRKIEQGEFKIVLLDIKLGGAMSGIDIIKKLKNKTSRPKIVVMSAITQDTLRPIFEQEKITGVIDGVLDKPDCCNPEVVLKLIKSLC